jgi:hypothetical protein
MVINLNSEGIFYPRKAPSGMVSAALVQAKLRTSNVASVVIILDRTFSLTSTG